MSAASRLLADEGPEALTVRRIAAAAGVSTMGVYSRFGNKDGVVDALYREGFEGLLEAMTAPPETDDPMVDLRACCGSYRAFAQAHATHYRIMFEGAVPGFEPTLESLTVAAATFEELAHRVARCVDAGLLTGGRPHEIAASLWATSHGLVSLELSCHMPESAGGDPYDRTTAALIRGFSPTG